MEASPYKSADIVEQILAAPLRDLSDDAIGAYAGSAILTVGTAEDYRHFLPRILELSVTNANWIGGYPPVIADRLRRSEWSDWPGELQSSVRDFFACAYAWSIDAPPSDAGQADLWLCGNLLMGGRPGDLLQRWRQDSSPHAALRLAEFRCAWADGADRGARLPFWEEVAAEAWDALVIWLLNGETAQQLAAALDRVAEEDRWQIERALTLVAAEVRH